MEQPPEQDRLFDDSVTLKLCLDGVYYAVSQNFLTKEQAEENMKKWFPEAEIMEP